MLSEYREELHQKKALARKVTRAKKNLAVLPDSRVAHMVRGEELHQKKALARKGNQGEEKSGSYLLFHTLAYSTIGDERLNC